MNTDEHRLDLNEITEVIIRCAFAVSNTLGVGFLEKVYENALAHELQKAGLCTAQQFEIPVYYDGIDVGKFRGDLLVDDQVLVELKCVQGLDDIHKAICLNYLRATGKKVCLLMNFAKPRLDYKRLML